MDNLNTTKDKVNNDIVDNGPNSVLVVNHNEILNQILEKTGKYVGSPFKARKEPNLGVVPVGVFFFNSNAMNETNDFIVTVSKDTADLNDLGLNLDLLTEGDYIHFKDFSGRSAYFIYKSHVAGTDANTDPIYDITIAGLSSNTNYSYQDSDDEICMLEFIKQKQTSLFLGIFTDLTALQTAHPTASAGNYANVDGGVGVDSVRYIWDVDDSKWVASGGGATVTNTSELVNDGENGSSPYATMSQLPTVPTNTSSFVNDGDDGANPFISESDLIQNYRSYEKSQLYKPNNLTDASNISWDMINITNAFLLATDAVGDNRTLPNSIISDAITLIGSNALIRGNSFVLTFKQDATGGRLIDFDSDYTVIGKFDTSPNAITKIYIIIEDSKALVVLTEFSGIKEPSQVTITTSTAITSETLSDDGYDLNGKNVLVVNGANDINFTVGATENQIFSIQKEGTGDITFIASAGKTIREVDGTDIMDGAIGSTATVSVIGTVISLRISNA